MVTISIQCVMSKAVMIRIALTVCLSEAVPVRISLTLRHFQGFPGQNIFNSASCPRFSWSEYHLQCVMSKTVLGQWAESKENHSVWDPYMPELTITSPYFHCKADYNTFSMGNPMPESTLALCQSQIYPPARLDLVSEYL
jgi:hypothetical protein